VVVLLAGSGGFALAGPSNGILYETFGSNGFSAINLTDPSMSLGNLFTPATNIVAGGGKVYFESGNTIYSTSPNLVGLNTVLNNNQTPNGQPFQHATLCIIIGAGKGLRLSTSPREGCANLYVRAQVLALAQMPKPTLAAPRVSADSINSSISNVSG
jgi:hypothetical protein